MPSSKICVIGLGYVGLPLAVAMARRFRVIGFDIKADRVAELRRGEDRTGEVGPADLKASTLTLTSAEADIAGADVYIVTVPTPVDDQNRPDLGAVRAACRLVGRAMKAGATVVLESTVYPGVTEDICGPELAQASGLTSGRDFFLGYSPERINPGDREHTVDRIVKVVAGQTEATTALLAEIYGAVTTGGVFIARSIKAAEAAKVIENAQRDINIAFINEVTMIFHRLGLSVFDVLEASRTKWNFLPFTPGLVGGHCIGVDPFYLADLARRIGHDPEVILAGRRINDHMGAYVADNLHQMLKDGGKPSGARVLMLGVTFKENVPDIRNSKVVDMVRRLESLGHSVAIHDPFASEAETREEYGFGLLADPRQGAPWDCVVGAVMHDRFQALDDAALAGLVVPNGVLADIKGMWRTRKFPATIRRWTL